MAIGLACRYAGMVFGVMRLSVSLHLLVQQEMLVADGLAKLWTSVFLRLLR
jgi:hypothetical protein